MATSAPRKKKPYKNGKQRTVTQFCPRHNCRRAGCMPGECSRAASQSTIVLLQASLSVAPHLPEVPQVRHLYWRDCSMPASHRRGTAILLEYYGGRRPRRTRTGRGGEGDVALQKGRAIWMKQLQLRLYWLQLQCGIIKPDPP